MVKKNDTEMCIWLVHCQKEDILIFKSRCYMFYFFLLCHFIPLTEILGMKEIMYQTLFVLDIHILTGIIGELLNVTIHWDTTFNVFLTKEKKNLTKVCIFAWKYFRALLWYQWLLHPRLPKMYCLPSPYVLGPKHAQFVSHRR